MEHIVYYLFKPSVALRERMAAYDSDLVEFLLLPVLWSNNEADRSPWRPVHHVAILKLLFLAQIKSQVGQDPLFTEYFGDMEISLENFDKWWFVERHGFDADYYDVEKQIDPLILQTCHKTGIALVDERIAKLQARQSS
jgi:hypothetical protein